MNQQPTPAYITIEQLLNRQLTDWQNLLAELESNNAPTVQLIYCQAQIDRLKGELSGNV